MSNNRNSKYISLDSLFSGKREIELDYFDRQNYFSATVISALMLAVDLFWIIAKLFGADISSFNHPLGAIGILFSAISSLIILIFLLKFKGLKRAPLNAVMLSLHFSIVISVLLLATGRIATIGKLGPASTYNGITLSTYYLIICAFLPFYRKRESIICMSFLFLSCFFPLFVLSNSSGYVLIGNIIIRVCSVVAYVVFRLITYRSASLQADLIETAYRDMQTGFLNMRALYEYFDTIGESEAERFGVLIYDLDDFKRFNDEYTHERGDIVLKRISEAVNDYLNSENAKIFRYNGDDFVAIFEDITDEKLLKLSIGLKDVVEKLRIERKDGTIREYMTITVGCTSASRNECMERDILNEAETQLYIGKKGAKNCVIFKGRIFVAEGEISMEQQPTHYTERVAQAIGEAMRTREMKAYYQPLYETTSHKLVGAEALSRWDKGNGEVILPAEFIPELEKNSSILALDWYMFEEACRMLSKQRDMNVPQVRISVNFSRMHVLYERNIERRLCEIADSYGIPHNLFEIEITESAYIHLPSIIDPFIKAIRAAGFLVAVDDFGSGASSLEFIKTVDVDTLKIDRSLISSKVLDEKERVLLESVVFLAHRLQLNSVAEGVETMEQMGFLKTLGVNQIQGYIFSKPLTEAEFIDTCRREAGNIADAGLLKNTAQTSSVQMLVNTVFKEYPLVLMSNLSRNSYYAMAYEIVDDYEYASAGSLTELFSQLTPNMTESDAAEFIKVFDVDKQIENHKKGMEKFNYTVNIRNKNGEPKSFLTTSYFIKEAGNDDLLVVTLCAEKKS